VSATPTLPPLRQERADALLDRFAGAPVLVVGDVMLDRFLVGRVERISPEAPVPIVAFDREESRAGGAANVAANVAALGGTVHVVGLVGADAAADVLRRALDACRVGAAELLTDVARRTTTKMRIVTTRNQQVARVDYETDVEAEGDVEALLIERVMTLAERVQALIVSDYLKGTVTRTLVSRLAQRARERAIPLLVDPKIPHLDYYAGATLVTPNNHEAEVATHMRIRAEAEVQLAARRFRDRARSAGVLVTRGEHGMWLLDGDCEGQLAATAREVADVTGAGDTVIAVLGLALAAGATSAEAAQLANLAAGIVVGRFGSATVEREELRQAIRTVQG
jgi:D-beta-D-heptose 7-phosphate kinase/D-beta-D-heptose 1-phosphate adenosyltransferase